MVNQAGTLIVDLAAVTGVAAVTAMVARRFGQPSILGYLLAGLIVGPYIPIPLFADPERVGALAEVGVVLVMFAVGLEFRIRNLAKVLPVSGTTAVIQIGALLLAGHVVGAAMGWPSAASITLGATLAISSTMVVSAVLRGFRVDSDVRSHIFGILVIQDIAAILLMAVVTTLASGHTLGFATISNLVLELSLVIVFILVAGLLVLPALIRLVLRRFDEEVLVVLVVGAAFGLASLAEVFGYSLALGAFIAGMAASESGKSAEIEKAIEPLRALFAAVFFVAIGMGVDPAMAWQTLPFALLLSLVVIGTHFIAVTAGSLLTGISLRRGVFSALALGQIGELSFILASIGIAGQVLPAETLPALVTVATVTAFTTPLLLRRGQFFVNKLDRILPKRFREALDAYQAVIRRSRRGSSKRAIQRAFGAVVLDWCGLMLLYVAVDLLQKDRPADAVWFRLIGAILAVPLLVGLVRSGRKIASYAHDWTRRDFSSDARARAVEGLTLVAITISIGVPTAAIVAPIFAGSWTVLVVAAVVVLTAIGLRVRSVQPGTTSEVAQLAFGLAKRVGEENTSEPESGEGSVSESQDPFSALGGLQYTVVGVETGSAAVGLTLAELNLRCRTGATVVAIARESSLSRFPTGEELLHDGDQLALAGSDEAIERGRELLFSAPPPEHKKALAGQE